MIFRRPNGEAIVRIHVQFKFVWFVGRLEDTTTRVNCISGSDVPFLNEIASELRRATDEGDANICW